MEYLSELKDVILAIAFLCVAGILVICNFLFEWGVASGYSYDAARKKVRKICKKSPFVCEHCGQNPVMMNSGEVSEAMSKKKSWIGEER